MFAGNCFYLLGCLRSIITFWLRFGFWVDLLVVVVLGLAFGFFNFLRIVGLTVRVLFGLGLCMIWLFTLLWPSVVVFVF